MISVGSNFLYGRQAELTLSPIHMLPFEPDPLPSMWTS